MDKIVLIVLGIVGFLFVGFLGYIFLKPTPAPTPAAQPVPVEAAPATGSAKTRQTLKSMEGLEPVAPGIRQTNQGLDAIDAANQEHNKQLEDALGDK